jgi:hypothetical protein
LKTVSKKVVKSIIVRFRKSVNGKKKLFFLIAINPITAKGGIKNDEVSIRGIKSISGNCAENERVMAVKKNSIIISMATSYRLFISVRAFKWEKVAQ